MSSPAKIAANRANSQRSTGPTSTEGKAASRGNALKHGFAANVVAVAGEDQAALDQEQELWVAELSKQSHVASRFAEQSFRAFVRLQRAERANDVALSARVRRADDIWRACRAQEIQDAVAGMDASPTVCVAQLRSTAEGCDWLKEAFEALVYNLNRNLWDLSMYNRAVQLLGILENGDLRLHALTMKLRSFESLHDDQSFPGGLRASVETIRKHVRAEEVERCLRVKATGEAASKELREFLTAQIAELTTRAESLRPLSVEDQAEAESFVLYDATPEGRLRDRYARAAEREMHRNHKAALAAEASLAEASAEPAVPQEVEPTPVPKPEARNEAKPEAESPTRSPANFDPKLPVSPVVASSTLPNRAREPLSVAS